MSNTLTYIDEHIKKCMKFYMVKPTTAQDIKLSHANTDYPSNELK